VEVLVHHGDDVARGETVKIDAVFYRDTNGRFIFHC
jgi:hypothetical protein